MQKDAMVKRKKLLSVLLVLALASLLVFSWVACNKPSPLESGEDTGFLVLSVKFAGDIAAQRNGIAGSVLAEGNDAPALAKSAAIISRVVITISAPDMKTIIKNIEVPAGTYTANATIKDIPSGKNRQVRLELCEADSTVRYEGNAIVAIQTDKVTTATIEVSGLGVNIWNLHPGAEVSDYLVYLHGTVNEAAEDSIVTITANGMAFPPARISRTGEFDAWIVALPGNNIVLVQDSKGRSDQIDLKGKMAAANPLFFLVWPEREGRLFNLHIYEPNGEHCYLDHATSQGGMLNKSTIGPSGRQFSARWYTMSGSSLQGGTYRIEVNYANKAAEAKVDAYVYAYLGSQSIEGPARLLGPHTFVISARQDENDGTNPDAWWSSASVSLPDGRFTSTATGPAQPVLASPPPDSIYYGRRVGFAWSRVLDARKYQLQVSLPDKPLDRDDFPAPLTLVSPHDTLDFTQDGVYIWRVRSLDGGGNAGAWTDDYKFQLTRNRLPEWSILPADSLYIKEDVKVQIELKATDMDEADLISLSIENRPNFVSFTDKGKGAGTLTLYPTSGDGSKGYESGHYKDIVLRATDNGKPPLSRAFTFEVFVSAKQSAPNLADIASFSMYEAEDAPKLVPVLAVDPNGDRITLSAENLPHSFASFLDQGNGTGLLSFNPGYADSGHYVIRVIAQDDGTPALTDISTFTINVMNKNRPPSLTNPGEQTNKEGETFSPGLRIMASDPDQDPLQYALQGGPTGLQIDQNGWISGIIAVGSPSHSPFLTTVSVSDGPTTISKQFKWNISNEKPVITNPGDQNDAEGGQPHYQQIQASDPNHEALIYFASNLPDGLSWNDSTGSIYGILANNAALKSPYNVILRVLDPSAFLMADTVSFKWYVHNPVPEWRTSTHGVYDEADNVSLRLEAIDDDQADLRYSLVGANPLPAGLRLDETTGFISGIISYEAAGKYQFTVSVSDKDTTAERTFEWTINNKNRAPRFTSAIDNQNSVEGRSVSDTLAAVDDDDDRDLNFSASGLPGDLTINAQTGLISGKLDFATGGGQPYPVTVSVSDGAATSSAHFTWTVRDSNRAPLIVNPGNMTSVEGDSIDLQILADDVDDDSVFFSFSGLEEAPLNTSNRTGKIWGKLPYSLLQPDRPQIVFPVTVTAMDENGGSSSVHFVWKMLHTNLAPRILPIANQTSFENQEVTLKIMATDEDSDVLSSFMADGLPPNLSIDPFTGIISGTIGFSASETSPFRVSITVSDGKLTSEVVTFNWYINK